MSTVDPSKGADHERDTDGTVPLREQHKRRNACIAAIVTVVSCLAVAGGVWWTAGDGSALVRNMFKPKATPATQPVVNSTAAFAYRTAPEFPGGWKPATEAPAM